jgi:sugar lactone lactonase YvrE
MSPPQLLLDGLAFAESPRWHDGRLWVADWAAQEIVAVDSEGESEVVVDLGEGRFEPISFDWQPDGRLLIVSSQARSLLRREEDGSLTRCADLTSLFTRGLNEVVVDGRGNAYVNGIGFDLTAGEEFAPGSVAVVSADGDARLVADGLAFPNGMAVTPDNSTLIVAESYANSLTAFDIGADGGLADRRVWAGVGDDHPDGICIDAEGAVWYGDVGNRRCVRVAEGGDVLETIELDRGCFACMLGGEDGRTLFMVGQEWTGDEGISAEARTGQVLTARAPAAAAGYPA